MKTFFRYTRLAALPLALLLPLGAQQNDTITRQQADAILSELKQIRQILERVTTPQTAQAPAPPTHAKMSLAGMQMLGNASAPLTIVEFTDYQCPFCQRFHVTTFAELKKNYIDTGKLRFYSRDLPLDIHSNALRAAEAARCAIGEGKYWQIRDIMGANPDKLDLEHLVGFATELKMDPAAFRACVTSEKFKTQIQADMVEAMKIGANGTPTFVIGKSLPDGVEGEVVMGALPFPVFEEKLKALEK